MIRKVYSYNDRSECVNPDTVWEFKTETDISMRNEINVSEYKGKWCCGVRFKTVRAHHYLPCVPAHLCDTRTDAIRTAVAFYDVLIQTQGVEASQAHIYAFRSFQENFRQLSLFD